MSEYYIDGSQQALTENELDIDKTDPSLNGQASDSLENKFSVKLQDFNRLFFSTYNINYIGDYFDARKYELRVITHPGRTKTCFEKAKILGAWDPLNIIKVFYFEIPETRSLYAVVIPETGCFIDKTRIKETLGIAPDLTVKKAKILPSNMSYGTCSPFIVEQDIEETDWKVEKIIFDTETLVYKKNENTLDDFSFGLDHRMSVHMNYYKCFKMLQERYTKIVTDAEVLNLSFKEKFVREKGKIKINYEFKTINYRTARFINSIHGYGDVTIENDYIDELDLPDVLTTPLDEISKKDPSA